MKSIKRYYTLKADPKDVYNALTNQRMVEIWTGEDAQMEPVPDTEFSLWEGSISGLNLEFEENKKIVQQWHFEGQEEKSIVTIILHPDKKGTSVQLEHTNIPDEDYDNMVDGWNNTYMAELKAFYEGE